MSIIETVRRKCRDCYKCLRACPVKAIKVERGPQPYEVHASVHEDFCVNCGTCIRECPQKAKRPRVDTDKVREMLRRGDRVAASLAPSFAALIDRPLRLVTALRKAGFSTVQETALGAEMVSRAHMRLLEESQVPYIGSACPAVVSLIERHYPEAIRFLAPLVSPAIAHGRYLKRSIPGVKVVFIGPCVAKKEEIDDPEVRGAVDVALTFDETLAWLREEGIRLEDCRDGELDGPFPSRARLFPADGGLLRSTVDCGLLSKAYLSVSGMSASIEMIRHFLSSQDVPRLVELLACPGGCIAGPSASPERDLYERRRLLIEYERSAPESPGAGPEFYESLLSPEELRRSYRNLKVPLAKPSEKQIKEILERTGKYSPQDELNCGSCGYSSCREKAIAVFNGMADPEMCIPYMRQRAESMANVVVGATPDGVIVTTPDGTVVDLNAAAERMLGKKKKEVLGTSISAHMDASLFEESARTMATSRGEMSLNGLVIDGQVVYVPDQKLLVGLFMDITEERRQTEKRKRVAEEAIERAKKVIEEQMEVAQKIAGLLGETTAETKISLTALMNVIKEEMPSSGSSKGGSGGSPAQ
ncbi:MAG TPA: PAS domain-containing protein [Firmicutes bacterium]|nr:PAS domain-containing protein [Candidatus Fermentithermobacillaceae bacterium]